MFGELTKLIYARLQESWDGEAAEQNAMEKYEYDRALRSLEKRTRLPRTRSLVREATAEQLKAPVNVPFPDHLALLQLSRDAEGRPRLLTTNFDTLFEHAARNGGLADVPSHAGISIPKAGGERDFGILHLHGRIADEALGLTDADLVLTSADFGDAYLRDGWASKYIEDRMRLGPLVLFFPLFVRKKNKRTQPCTQFRKHQSNFSKLLLPRRLICSSRSSVIHHREVCTC